MVNIEDQEKIIRAKIAKVSEIAEETLEITFVFDDKNFSFIAGQYVWVELLKLDFPDTRGFRRAFSIVSDPAIKGKITIIFRKSESGYKKTLLSLPIGSEVRIFGPYGSIILPSDVNTPAVFIAGGSGVAPFFSMISNEINQKTGRRLELFCFNDNQNRTPYLEELKKLSQDNPIFKLHLFFGKIEENINLDIFKEIHNLLGGASWYVAGPKGMVNVLADIFIKIKIPSELINYEENYPVTNTESETDKDYFFKLEIFKQAVAQSSNHIIFTDENGTIKFVNNAAEQMTGYSFNEMVGQTPRLWGSLMDHSFYESLWNTIKIKRKPFLGKLKNHRKDGSYYFALARISPIFEKNGDLIGFLGTEEDITELENIDRAKTEFISLASHQLRTPITALNWYSEILMEDNDDFKSLNDKQKNYIKEIFNINKLMGNLVNDLLDVSHIDLGKMEINYVPVDMTVLSQSILSELEPEILKKKITIIEKYQEKLPVFMIDKKIAGIIIQNLLTNAVRYTPADKNGEVVVSIDLIKKDEVVNLKKVTVESLLITVKDNGIGIPLNQSHKIFSKMFRADNARENEKDGNGLGLYMVKKVVEAISGDIWFISEEGKGTTFYVLLPFKENITK